MKKIALFLVMTFILLPSIANGEIDPEKMGFNFIGEFSTSEAIESSGAPGRGRLRQRFKVYAKAKDKFIIELVVLTYKRLSTQWEWSGKSPKPEFGKLTAGEDLRNLISNFATSQKASYDTDYYYYDKFLRKQGQTLIHEAVLLPSSNYNESNAKEYAIEMLD